MNVLFAASECAPFIKTGGLGDVAGALPKALTKQGAHVSVVLPKYEDIPYRFQRQMTFLTWLSVPVGWRNQYCGIFFILVDDVTYYFLDNEYYFKRRNCYGYADDGERFAFFSRAVLDVLPHLSEWPSVIHCHDWQTAPICALLKNDYFQSMERYRKIKTVFTIHNLKYQGVFPHSVLHDLLALDDRFFQPNGVEFYGCVSYMKAGLAYADHLTTVSPSYAEEIQTPYYGERLDGFLRHRSIYLSGIVNGIDRFLYDPKCDTALVQPFTDPKQRAANKAALQRQLNLSVDKHMPMIGMVTRLVEQKGIDLVLHVFRELMQLNVQFVLLGTGDSVYEDAFRTQAQNYAQHVSANIFFDDTLARRIYASADLFLMPSKFEPCGIGQLIAMRYGCLPLVRETGGLKDTVQPYNYYTGEGCGFSFANYNAHDLLKVTEMAVNLYRSDPTCWLDLCGRAMALDFGWSASAALYLSIYHEIVGGID
ncbi:MAG: glycogen synthase GlgA [Sporolactobacillus sp.]